MSRASFSLSRIAGTDYSMFRVNFFDLLQLIDMLPLFRAVLKFCSTNRLFTD